MTSNTSLNILSFNLNLPATLSGPQPPLAIVPFDASKAKEHHQAWAKYLGTTVEKEIELPGGVKTRDGASPDDALLGQFEVAEGYIQTFVLA